jgi:hypothetical protein
MRADKQVLSHCFGTYSVALHMRVRQLMWTDYQSTDRLGFDRSSARQVERVVQRSGGVDRMSRCLDSTEDLFPQSV